MEDDVHERLFLMIILYIVFHGGETPRSYYITLSYLITMRDSLVPARPAAGWGL